MGYLYLFLVPGCVTKPIVSVRGVHGLLQAIHRRCVEALSQVGLPTVVCEVQLQQCRMIFADLFVCSFIHQSISRKRNTIYNEKHNLKRIKQLCGLNGQHRA